MKANCQSDLEVRLQNLKDKLLEELKGTKLIVDPRVIGFSITYEKRRGLKNAEGCKVIEPGLRIMLKKAYGDYVNIRFDMFGEDKKTYRATLEVLAETKEEESELAYQALSKINEFMSGYNKFHSRKK